jgi:hypothetical protein
MMLFSCLAHFAWWLHAVYPSASANLATIGMVATPSFLLISGAMVGLLASTSTDLHQLKIKLLNRGLFLLTIGHALISLAEAHQDGGLLLTIRNATVVDEIGLATLIASLSLPFLADEHRAWRVATFGIAAFSISWCIVLFWHPTSHASIVAKQVLWGGDAIGRGLNVYTSPTLQYLSIYAIGIPMGHLLRRHRRPSGTTDTLAANALAAGLFLSAGALMWHLGADALASHLNAQWAQRALTMSFRISHKMPPTPLYLVFYAGVSLLLTGTLLTLSTRDIASWLTTRLATIGRASLFVFVLQYFLYWTLPDLLGISVNRWCALVFIVNVLLIYHAAATWVRYGGNRWLTFGITIPRRGDVQAG